MSNLPVAMQATLPAHLRSNEIAAFNDEARSGIGSGFLSPPRISLRGSAFRLVVDGVETTLMRKDEEGNKVKASGINVVIVGTNKGKYKTYYGGKKYDPAAESEAPICYSYDGERPSPHAAQKQCETCAACPHNEFGSAVTEQGNKTRACSDNKLIAVIDASAITNRLEPGTLQGNAYQLKIPPTGLNRNKETRKANPADNTSWLEFVELMNNFPTAEGVVKVGIPYIVTRVFFDMNSDYPLARYKPVRYLTEEEVEQVNARMQGEDVRAAISEVFVDGTRKPVDDEAFETSKNEAAEAARAAEAEKAEEAKRKAAAKAKRDADEAAETKARAKADAAKAAAENDDGGTASFGDDAPAQPAKAAAAKPARAPKPAKAAPTLASAASVISDDEAAEIESLFQ